MEKKEYSTVGTVTIGTDEYRDLIADGIENRNSADEYRRKFWDEQSKASELEKKLDVVARKLEIYESFFNEVEGVSDKFKLWRISKEEE